MKTYQFLKCYLNEAGPVTSSWIVELPKGATAIASVDGGQKSMDVAELNILNKLGEDGWYLGSKALGQCQHAFYMQREIDEP